MLSPVVKLHLYRTYICPIIRSGLSSLTLRQTTLQPLIIFQRKILRSILKLSKWSSIPALHFLTGELPVEGKVHRDVFSLFYCTWANPNTKIHEIVNYLLKMSTENSRTWSIFLRQLCQMYGLADPLQCFKNDVPKKSEYKEAVHTKITAFYEKNLRDKAETNSCMTYLNVSVSGLRGKRHPALSNMMTTRDVEKSRPHIKMLCKDYYTYEKRSDQSGGSAHCRSCSDTCTDDIKPVEDIPHILSSCMAYSDIRERILLEYAQLSVKSEFDFNCILSDSNRLTQFILDPSSLNLPRRISYSDKNLSDFFKISRDLCYSVHTRRMNILKSKNVKSV